MNKRIIFSLLLITSFSAYGIKSNQDKKKTYTNIFDEEKHILTTLVNEQTQRAAHYQSALEALDKIIEANSSQRKEIKAKVKKDKPSTIFVVNKDNAQSKQSKL